MGAEVRFTVEDTGPGIGPQARTPIFDRFFQARRADRSGAGLGLAIAKGIVDAHGGRIGVESQTEGPRTGTTFVVTVPVLAPAAAEVARAAGPWAGAAHVAGARPDVP